MSVVDMSTVGSVAVGGATERSLGMVAAEINVIKEQTAGVIARSIFEIGKRLCEAKALIGHGNWGAWLRENVDYSESTARSMMRIYTEMGDEQIDMISGEAPIDVFETLNMSQMVALFPLPQSERIAFVKEHGVKDMSVREVDALVTEAVKKARETAQAEYTAQLREKQELVEGLEKSLEGAEESRRRWNEIANDFKVQGEEAKIRHEAELRELRARESKLEEELEELKRAPAQEKIVYVEKEPAKVEEDARGNERAIQLAEELEAVRAQLAAAEDARAAAEAAAARAKDEATEEARAVFAQKQNPMTLAVGGALRQIGIQIDDIAMTLEELKKSDAELASTLAFKARESIKAMLDGAEF